MKRILQQSAAARHCRDHVSNAVQIEHGRGGATLSEALVALMIMSIGVISLASLFPIAVLKTARANQLTVATDIYKNAKELTALHPDILDLPRILNQPGPPYIFDPLATAPGRKVVMSPRIGLIPRLSGVYGNSMAAAEAICAGNDTWTVNHDDVITSIDATRTSIQLNGLAATNSLTYPGANQMRVQIFYNGGKSSFTRMITGITAGPTLVWSEVLAGGDQNGNGVLDARALPAGITYESAKVETRVRRYTWTMTVAPRASFADLSIKYAIFFGREFSLDDEQVYGTIPQGSTFAVQNMVAGSFVNLQEMNKYVTVSWPAGQQPNIKRGGWLFDAQNGFWYQIENYTDYSLTNKTTITLTVAPDSDSQLLVFPRGVVDVF